MIRSLKLAIAVAGLLAAVGVLGASGAEAAEFHCSVEPCRLTLKPDGTGKTAHQVLTIKRQIIAETETTEVVSFTCSSVSGEATMATKTKKELTITNVAYQDCTVAGTEAGVKMNGCDYLLNASGEMWIKCPAGKKVEWNALGCTATIGEQGPLFKASYHDAGTTKSELTVETAVKGIKGTVDAGCAMQAGEFAEGEIETGNVILTAETDNAEAKMANVWWE